ncbi:LysM peptidoglycan-binding domain-containing protein [Niallia sp. Krafla_26]|uniref:LysM peptidoglycan-binding domain-containing protein n=1 Tax=Niallia sp. Krafla_26 TaxID=3064703 RepID=UPI003D174888
MNKERPYRDQAERLRQKLDKSSFEKGQIVEREELPPRSRVHQKNRKKNKWKLKYPIIRLLVLFFILLPITIFSIYSSLLKEPVGNVKETFGETSSGFEVIDIESSEPQEDIRQEEQDPNRGNQDDTSEIEIEEGQSQSNDSDRSSITIDSIVNETKSETNDIIHHKVKPGETIYRISLKYYHSKAGIETIKRANQLMDNRIISGQVLIIPLTK